MRLWVLSSSDDETHNIDELNNIISLISACSSHGSQDGVLVHKEDEGVNSTDEFRALLNSIPSTSDYVSMDPGSVTVQSAFDSVEASRLDSVESNGPLYYHSQDTLLYQALPRYFIDYDSSSEEFAPVTFDPELFLQFVEDSQNEVDLVQKIVEADVTGIDTLEECFKLFKTTNEHVDDVIHDSKGKEESKPVLKHFRESMKNMAASSRDSIPSLKNANIEV